MKITRKMLHEDLQGDAVYRMQKMASYLYRYEWSTKLATRLVSRQLQSLPSNGMSVEERALRTSDGEAEIRVKIYRPENSSARLPAMLYTHGGGYITGSPEAFAGTIARFIRCRPCVVVAPAYRTAFVKPYPAAFDDCYMCLLWMRDHADELGIDARSFMVGGHSAGGGLTAAVTLKARDTGEVKVAFQMPFYPMIDDQQPDDPERYMDAPGWSTKTNAFGWASYLKDLRAHGEDIPAYAAPSRNTDYRGLPPTITFVGEYEPFYWETVEYVRRLKAAGVEVAFKVYDKCTHGPDMLVPDTPLGRDCLAFSLDHYADFYDRFVVNDGPGST